MACEPSDRRDGSGGLSISRLGGKTAVVTGGTSGIGLKIVQLFRAHGANVVFTGRDIERGRSVAESTKATFVQADAAQPGHGVKIVDAALRAFGGIDVLVNNAGAQGKAQGIENFAPDLLTEAVTVHLGAPWELMGLVAPEMRKRGGGSIINISSIAGHRVGARSVPYAVSKAGLLHLTRYAAVELGKDHIRVNSVSPGFIATAKNVANIDMESDPLKTTAGLQQMLKFTARQALPRPGRTADIAEAVLFLSSDESSFVTGTDLVIDGGMVWGQSDFFHT